MLRQQVVALVCAEGRGECVRLAGGSFEDVAVAVMRGARANFLAPTEDEAFVGALGALGEAFPDLPILAEAQALGDRSKLMAALMNPVPGVTVDIEAAEAGLAPFPDPPLGLVELWLQSA